MNRFSTGRSSRTDIISQDVSQGRLAVVEHLTNRVTHRVDLVIMSVGVVSGKRFALRHEVMNPWRVHRDLDVSRFDITLDIHHTSQLVQVRPAWDRAYRYLRLDTLLDLLDQFRP